MQYYKCECGEHEMWTSGGPTPCARCEKCGSGFGGTEPLLHRLSISRVKTDNGDMPLSHCIWCAKTKLQLEKLNEPFEFLK